MTSQLISRVRSAARTAAICLPVGLVAACATGQPPVAQMATARESIRQAESAGAAELAPVELLAARDKLARADAATRDKHYEQATQLTDEAAADADLAEHKTRAAKARLAQQELARSNGVLADEVSRKSAQ